MESADFEKERPRNPKGFRGRLGIEKKIDGGDDETRTHYLDNANVALYQMSYAPKGKMLKQKKYFFRESVNTFFFDREKFSARARCRSRASGVRRRERYCAAGANGKKIGMKIVPRIRTMTENGTPSFTKSMKR